MRSVMHLYNVDPGFNPQDVITMNLALQGAKYPEESTANCVFTTAIDERMNNFLASKPPV